ncbi:cytochrome C1 heme lyase [Myxozyma melibiosi]|uniref:Holocytochrome c-type synthase n=1 Tax=Myxozyma melibiosi TaxID=54550 RepID=A0ABR1F4N7_9ASCO
MSDTKDSAPSGCPVPHDTPSSSEAACPVDHTQRKTWMSTLTGKTDDKPLPPTAKESVVPKDPSIELAQDREISSIPRADAFSAYNGGEGGHGGAIRGTSKWVYPSEEMFYKAMKRKNWDPEAADMRVVVPIHNAVNERAWNEILQWERPMGASKCGGPKLVSFSGDAKNISPRARFNSLLGYSLPFDRHDWIVDRCGTRIEYIIDFYAGKPNPQNPGLPSFYLDVRPKLTYEGAKMRIQRFFGLI